MTRDRHDSLVPFRRRARRRLVLRIIWWPALTLAVCVLGGAGWWLGGSAGRAQPSTSVSTTTEPLPSVPAPIPTSTGSISSRLPTQTPPPVLVAPSPPATRVPVATVIARPGAGPLLLVVDSSNSMRADFSGMSRIDHTRSVLADLLSTLPEQTRVQLWAYGLGGDATEQGKAASCAPGQALTGLGSPKDVRPLLTTIRAQGWTPLAATLTEIAASYPSGPLRVVVLSDGVESCDGDPVAAATRLHAGDTTRQIVVVGLSIESNDQEHLQQLAEAGGGQLLVAPDAKALRSIILGE